uniref:Protein phosphatase 1D-like n=1 Tax=Petromyzon marinus TaxID=7757 RepID=A0AAJ7SMB5_PETMA|nr:protein phosphatase 1D-like [Petromyzon marinus]
MSSPLKLIVSADSNRGGRRYMEDITEVSTEGDGDAIFLAVFDGHGGPQAARFARRCLWPSIRAQPGLWGATDPAGVCHAIRDGFLACQRAMWEELGDLWSYDFASAQFVVSPEPDVSAYRLDPGHHRYLVLATDGVWDVLTPTEAVALCHRADAQQQHSSSSSGVDLTLAQALVAEALSRWHRLGTKADNVSAVVARLCPSAASPAPRLGADGAAGAVLVAGGGGMVAGGSGGGAVRASALARSGTEVLRGPGTEELPSNNSSSSNNNSNSSSGNSSSGKFTPLLADLGCSQEEIPSKRSRRSGPHEGTASD